MENNTTKEWVFPPAHHLGVVVEDINKAIKDIETIGLSKSAFPTLPAWLEKMMFRGKYFDKTYSFLGLGPYIHPMMYQIITVDPDYANPHPALPGLTSEPLYRGEPFNGRYKIYKIYLGNKILELIEPGKEGSPWKEHLDQKGEGFHHIAFNVDDLEGITSKLLQQGATSLFHARLEDGTGGDYLDLGSGLVVEIFKGFY